MRSAWLDNISELGSTTCCCCVAVEVLLVSISTVGTLSIFLLPDCEGEVFTIGYEVADDEDEMDEMDEELDPRMCWFKYLSSSGLLDAEEIEPPALPLIPPAECTAPWFKFGRYAYPPGMDIWP
ncbi:hypothetical protein WICPIJ_005668 [Wickerhamomyces pijperi]|uniref:Uncharacterized protein n=1 Tax=Wickerhamomyces pijperi TaxID=599730 RepID=A0A9P8TLR1_WICPI|nr:hypothetical protein WICPIJ_005668 [Wickerhamomyces pijperi]